MMLFRCEFVICKLFQLVRCPRWHHKVSSIASAVRSLAQTSAPMGANEKALIIPGLASPGPVYVLPSQFANAAKRSARCAHE